MGTDIHLTLQVQDAKTNEWYQPQWDKPTPREGSWRKSILDDCVSDRNYSLFYYLSGVRYTYDEPKQNPLWRDRGIPKDIQQPNWEDLYNRLNKLGIDIGDHSYTYFDVFEWRQAKENGQLKVIEKVAPNFYYYVDSIFGDKFSSSYSERWKGIQNMRVLVGYDS